MHGNVDEWCEDWYAKNYNNTPRNGKANNSGEQRSKILRGGCWYDYASYTRSANRNDNSADYRSGDYGFRIVRTK